MKDTGKDTGTEVLLNTSATELISDQSGRITGLRAQTDFHFGRDNTNLDEKEYEFKAIVVATGGFSADVPFRQAQDPRLGPSMKTTNKKSATAEVLKGCMQIGANPVQLSRIQLGPWTSPDEEGYGAGPLFGDYVVLPYGLLVDPLPVSRFVNELTDRGRLADAILACGHPVIGITDACAIVNDLSVMSRFKTCA